MQHAPKRARHPVTTPAAFTLFLAVGGLCLSCSNRGSVAVGGACRADESCVTGVCIPEASTASSTAWSGGYCSGNCATTTCPQGLCLTLADGRSYCVSECAGDGDCRAGYVCSAGVGACLPDCRLGWSCGSFLVCDMATGACTLPMPVSGNTSLGSACTINLECATGMCIPERSGNGTVAWTGGLCSQECASAACPAGSACAPMEDGSAYCVPVCASPADCRAGYVCDVEIAGCLPDCRLGWSCGTQLVCDASNGSCVSPAHADAGTRDGGAADSGQGDAGGRGDNDAGGFGPGDAGGFGPDDVGGRGDNDAGGFGPGGDDAGRGSGASPGGMWATGPQPLR
ncbi:MAG: hypothetical protein JXP73_12690 [Deltaproteobacteria bacterium]|nr:hypothetical protein [Deltaproteobacteria bacterium]